MLDKSVRKHPLCWTIGSVLLAFVAWRELNRATQIPPLLELQANDTPIKSIAFSPNGRLIAAVVKGGYVRVWSLDDGQKRFTSHDLFGAVNVVGWSPDGRVLFAGTENGQIWGWNRDRFDEVIRSSHLNLPINHLLWIPGSDRIAAAVQSQGVRFFAGGKWQDQVVHVPNPFGLAISPDAKRMAVRGERSLQIYDLDSFANICRTESDYLNTRSSPALALSKDRGFVLFGRMPIVAYDLESPQPTGLYLLVRGTTDSCAMSPNGKYLVVGGTRRTSIILESVVGMIHLIDLDRNRMACVNIPGEFIYCVAVSPDGRFVGAGGSDGRLRIYRTVDLIRAIDDTKEAYSEFCDAKEFECNVPDGRIRKTPD